MIKQENCIIPINAPSLDNMLKDSVKKKLYSWSDRSVQTLRAEKVLKPEYLNFLGFEWKTMLAFFKRAGAKDPIHHDERADNRPHAWAINWVYKGQGYHNFWDESNVTRVGDDHTLEPTGYAGIKFKSDLPPDISVFTDTSTPYMVNIHIPHQVHALTDRMTFSLRATSEHLNMPWDEILTRLNTHNTVESMK